MLNTSSVSLASWLTPFPARQLWGGVLGAGPCQVGEGLAQVISMHEMPTNQILSIWIQIHADAAIESTCKPHVMMVLWNCRLHSRQAIELATTEVSQVQQVTQLGPGFYSTSFTSIVTSTKLRASIPAA